MTKLLGLAFLVLAAFLLPPVILVVLIPTVLAVAASAGLFWPLVRTLRLPSVLLASILLVNGLFFPGGQDRLVSLGPLGVTREGVTFGLISAGRILVAFLASVLFLQSTLADDLMESVVQRGASHRIAFVILSAIQMVPRLQARAADILDAQQARGLSIGGSVRQRARALVPLVAPVLLGSLIDVRERTFALEARAFGASRARTAYRIVPDAQIDRWLRIALSVAIVMVVIAAVTGFPRL